MSDWEELGKALAANKPGKPANSVTIRLPATKPGKKPVNTTPTVEGSRRNYVDPGSREYVEEVSKSGARGVVEGVTGVADIAPYLSPGLTGPLLGKLISDLMSGKPVNPFPITEAVQKPLDDIIGPEEEVPNQALNLTKRGARLAGNIAVPVGPVSGAKPLKYVAEVLGGAATGVGAGEVAAETVGEEWRPVAEMLGALPGVVAPTVAGKLNSVRKIAEGRAATGYEPMRRVVLDLEGGGTVDAPKTSKKGAFGPMQTMPATLRDPGLGVKPWNGTTEDTVRLGEDYLAALMKKYKGNEAKVLAAYNGGFGRVDKLVKKYGDDWWRHLPSESKKYMADGLKKLDIEVRSEGVRPIAPEEIARVMDDPEAAGLASGERMVDGRLKVGEEVAEASAEPLLPKKAASNVTRMDDVRTQRDVEGAIRGYEDMLEDSREVLRRVQEGSAPPKLNFDELARVRQMMVNERTEVAAEGLDELGDILDLNIRAIDDVFANSGVKPPVADELADSAAQFTTGSSDVPRAANDVSRLDGAKNFIRSLLNDERGSLGYRDGGEEPPVSPHRPVEAKMIQALKSAKSARGSQNYMYSKERSERYAEVRKISKYAEGEAGLYAKKAALKGVYKEADYDSIRSQFEQSEIDELHNIINKNNATNDWDKIRAGDGLEKMLDGKIPNDGEIKVLQEIFPEEMMEAFRKHAPLGWAANIANIPRTAMSTADLSAPFRQGIFLIGRKEFWKSMGPMLKYFKNEDAFRASMSEIKSRPTYQLMKDADLALTDLSGNLSSREEAFMSNLVEKIPVAGRLVRASNRAHVGYLNRLRADTFDSLIRDGAELGIDWANNPNGLRELGNFLNFATGRGNLPGMIKSAAPLLNGVFFSPRLISSRIRALNPKYYLETPFIKDPAVRFVRKEATKSLLTMGGILMTVLTLASMAGADVELDPRSSDFSKIKVGNTRYEITGGFSPYARLVARLITGVTKTASGKEIKLGEDFGAKTGLDVVEDFFHSKESPIASFVTDWLRGSDVVGNKFELTNFSTFEDSKNNPVVKRLFPMYFQDVTDAVQEHGLLGPLISAPGIVGVSVQTYEPKKSKPKGKPKKTEWDAIADSFSEFGASYETGWEAQ
jgi:hypothetical protein